ncbi:MAG: acyl carrier protein [Clostridia bacterium]|nr:acyl carrier protein [Clostridia bacterium]
MFDKVKALLVEELSINPDDIKPEAELENDLGINSLELADLVFLCEEKFSIQIDDDDIKNLITVGDVVNYLESLAK